MPIFNVLRLADGAAMSERQLLSLPERRHGTYTLQFIQEIRHYQGHRAGSKESVFQYQ